MIYVDALKIALDKITAITKFQDDPSKGWCGFRVHFVSKATCKYTIRLLEDTTPKAPAPDTWLDKVCNALFGKPAAVQPPVGHTYNKTNVDLIAEMRATYDRLVAAVDKHPN